jgi:hypothetical protein
MKLKLSELTNNTGQIEGVPANPRQINKEDYARLLKSLTEDPDYLNHEMPHVIKHGNKYVVLNGNQRLRALKELGYKETPVTIYAPDTSPEIIRSRIIKSNHGYGTDDQDMIANEWNDYPLEDWGLNIDFPSFLPSTEDEQGQLDEKKKTTCPECGHAFEA